MNSQLVINDLDLISISGFNEAANNLTASGCNNNRKIVTFDNRVGVDNVGQQSSPILSVFPG